MSGMPVAMHIYACSAFIRLQIEQIPPMTVYTDGTVQLIYQYDGSRQLHPCFLSTIL